jgi:acyl-CoA dehydrogenase
MRAIGLAERSLDLMVDRVLARTAFGGPLADQGVIQTWMAESRIELEQARLLVLKAAWMIDTVGAKAARTEIAAIKVVAARTACRVIDRAVQAFGGAGMGPDVPLGLFYSHARHLRLADGPDEVHLRTVARQEINRRRASRSAGTPIVSGVGGGA